MYNGIQKIEEVINYIESHITSDLDCNMLAAKMNLSVYEFRRIFSFVLGCPISEYIRKRRLSLAACEIMSSEEIDMLKLSEKYGYTSQSAFIKAFGEQHGVPLKDKCEIHLFTRPSFEWNISGRESVSIQIRKSEAFCIQGFSGTSNITDSCCCENVWNEFYESGTDQKLLDTEGHENLYVSYQNNRDDVVCTIGISNTKLISGFSHLVIPESRWACFTMYTVDDNVVNEKYSKILYEYLPSANLKRREDIPTVEIFPFDMSEDGFEWEIRIPICD